MGLQRNGGGDRDLRPAILCIVGRHRRPASVRHVAALLATCERSGLLDLAFTGVSCHRPTTSTLPPLALPLWFCPKPGCQHRTRMPASESKKTRLLHNSSWNFLPYYMKADTGSRVLQRHSTPPKFPANATGVAMNFQLTSGPHSCPRCGSFLIRKSCTKRWIEQISCRFLSFCPYRCEDCDTRFLGFRSTARILRRARYR
jgi:hypothetical protein